MKLSIHLHLARLLLSSGRDLYFAFLTVIRLQVEVIVDLHLLGQYIKNIFLKKCILNLLTLL